MADLDGTLLHDGETFEERFLTQRSIDSINRLHDAGMTFVVEENPQKVEQVFNSYVNLRTQEGLAGL